MGDLIHPLKLGADLTRELAGGASHEYSLELPADQFLQVIVEQRGVDVIVELLDSQGEPLLGVDSPLGRYGQEVLTAVTDATGRHLLRLRAGEPQAPAGSYRLVLTELHPATAEERRRAQAERLMAQGEELRRQATQESLGQAQVHYQAALTTFQELGDRDRAADVRSRLASVHKLRGEREAAVELFEQALASYRASPQKRRELGFNLNYLGDVYRELGQDETAERTFAEAFATFQDADLSAQDVVATTLNNLGLIYRARGEIDRALTVYRQALELWRQLQEPREEVMALNNIGNLLTVQGKLAEAVDQLDQALGILALHPFPFHEGQVLANRAEARKRQGQLEDAAADLTRALELLQPFGDPLRLAKWRNNLGTIQLLRGEREPALQLFTQALAIYQQAKHRQGEALTHHHLGRLHLPDGDWPGDPRQALTHFDAAASLWAGGGDPQIVAANLYGSARALRALGEFQAARERLAGALQRVEEVRSEAGAEDLRIAFFASKQHYFDLYIDILMHLHAQDPQAGYAAAAFEVAERRRGRALLDLLGESADNLRAGVDAALVAQEQRVQAALNALENRRFTLASSGESRDAGADLPAAELDTQVRQLRLDLGQIRQRLRQMGSPVTRISPQPRSLEEIRRRLLDPHSVLLVYSLGEDRSFLWQITAEGLRSHELPARRQIEAEVNSVYNLLRMRRAALTPQRDQLLVRLGRTLLGPVADDLEQKRLLIAADGALHTLPFAALIAPGTSERLVKRHEIVYLPSASILLTLRDELAGRQPAPRPIAIFADPVFTSAAHPQGDAGSQDLSRAATGLGLRDFAPLPNTRTEAEEIAKLFGDEALTALGHAATKKAVLTVAGQFQILHFATHGLLNQQDPELSGLVLSLFDERGQPCDGFLRLHELYNLRLQAELAVLSACQTGLGQQARGEGLLGLTRGFMYAGVPRVLVSLWNVSDQATAELMKRFYWALTEGGASPSQALRAAQLALIEEDPSGEGLGHPFFWAPFVLQGEWLLPAEVEGGIEASRGSGGYDPDGVDLPTPVVCQKLSEGWARQLCDLLHRLRTVPPGGRETTRGARAVSAPPPASAAAPGDGLLHFNGIDALTGLPVQPPLAAAQLARSIVGLKRKWAEERDLEWSFGQFKDRGKDRRPMPDVDPKDLATSGWGVIFATSTPNSVRDALWPLIRQRRELVTAFGTKNQNYFRELEYQPGDTKQSFFRRYQVEPGPAHPRQLPYYLLIVGDPDTIPNSFQYLLDLQYAVGRLHFEDVDGYAHYAAGVLAAESGDVQVRPEATFFSVQNPGDQATRQTHERLVTPLAKDLRSDRQDWPVRVLEQGTKAQLGRLLGSGETPALLFTAAHGLKLPCGHSLQATHQGAVVCQDWPGGPVDPAHCFAGVDLGPTADLRGLIAFLFGCYSAGTPRTDNFPLQAFRSPALAPKSMIAPLAESLLGHPRGGALAVVGHVDRAWTRSFSSTQDGTGYLHFLSLLKYLLDGHPIGSAMDWMNERFAELSTELTERLNLRKETLKAGDPPEIEDPQVLADLWRANNDARNFAVLGDPAVRLAMGAWASAGSSERPAEKLPGTQDILARLRTRAPVQLSVAPNAAVRAERESKEPS